MKLDFEPLQTKTGTSIHVKKTTEPYLAKNWHFHPEYELLYIIEGQGMRVVGDHISSFNKGELVLIGKWLPHLWRHDKKSSERETKALYYNIKFLENYNGINQFDLPEMHKIKQLLKQSKNGILFNKKIIPRIHEHIIAQLNNDTAGKQIHFLQMLHILSNETDFVQLAGDNFISPHSMGEESRLQKVINYVFNNYNRQITLEEISDIAIMTPTAFCRYFKQSTNKTFNNFLNEFRVAKTCQYLQNSNLSIRDICFEVGFQSPTNFNRTFKHLKLMTPKEYRTMTYEL